MFVDKAEIFLRSGKGGDGAVSLEKKNTFLTAVQMAVMVARWKHYCHCG